MDKFNQIQSKIKSFENQVSSVKGKLDLIEEQYSLNIEKIEALKESQVINAQAVEVLKIVQLSTREKIKKIFETTVSYALQYINQSNDYQFELEFGTRGNLNTLRFLIKTPEMKNFHDILDCHAGGNKDIVALALRFVLLEISKYPGFLFLDEPMKRLDSPEKRTKVIEFIKENQNISKRQIFIITHEPEVIDSVDNAIFFNSKMSTSNQCPQNNGHLDTMDNKSKRRRGRPKKEKK